MLTKECIAALQEEGFTLWEGSNRARLYFPATEAGLEIERHKSGSISHAELNGEKISNNQAGRMLNGTVYINAKTGDLICDNAYDFHVNAARDKYEAVKEALKEPYLKVI